MIRVLYDGWSLLRRANSPEALHLLSILGERHAGVQATVALPDQPPPWLPEGIAMHVLPAADTPLARLLWEQRSLPRLAKKLTADLLHLTTRHPPLLGDFASVVSLAEYSASETPSLVAARLREALASGGWSRLRGLLLPSDLRSLPPQDTAAPVYHLPVDPAQAGSGLPEHDPARLEYLRLPETFILYHGPGDGRSLHRLLAAWSWAAGAIGEYYPLVVLGLDQSAQVRMQALLQETDLKETVQPLPVVEPTLVPLLYRACSVVFHPAELPAWSTPGWLSLHCGKPLVAAENPLVAALAGPAAYLLPGQDARRLGAGLLTVIVEEQVGQELSQAGEQRAATWDRRSFRDELYAAYQAILANA